MPTSVTMPQLGESVTEGTVTRWLKSLSAPKGVTAPGVIPRVSSIKLAEPKEKRPEAADRLFEEGVKILSELEILYDLGRCYYEWGVRIRPGEVAAALFKQGAAERVIVAAMPKLRAAMRTAAPAHAEAAGTFALEARTFHTKAAEAAESTAAKLRVELKRGAEQKNQNAAGQGQHDRNQRDNGLDRVDFMVLGGLGLC